MHGRTLSPRVSQTPRVAGVSMLLVEQFNDGSTGSVIVEEAGIATSDQDVPQGHLITVPAAS